MTGIWGLVRSINLSRGQESKVEGFPLNTLNMPNSYHGATGMPWCQKCNERHLENCSQGRGCYVCERVGHMKRNCPMLSRQQGSRKGAGGLAQGMVPSSGSVLGPSPIANAPHPAATQATVLQPWTHG